MSAQDGAPARRLRSLAAHLTPGPGAASGADGDAPKPKLLYFNSVGKCYGVRMAMFAAFGKDGWEDHRVRGGMAGDEWKELQPVLESGSLPELTLPGGEVVCQSHAIARYAGAMSRGAGHDLYPTDPGQAVLVDEARLPPPPLLPPSLPRFTPHGPHLHAVQIVAFAHEVLEKAPRGQGAREAFYQGGFLEKAAKLMERKRKHDRSLQPFCCAQGPEPAAAA